MEQGKRDKRGQAVEENELESTLEQVGSSREIEGGFNLEILSRASAGGRDCQIKQESG